MTPVLGVMVSHKAPALMERDYVRDLASVVEKEGAESLWIGDHPARTGDADGMTFPSPLEWLTLAACHSNSIKLGTAVLVLPFEHPVVLAKRVATLDRISGGRVVLGVGVGSSVNEAQALEIDTAQRAAIATESIEVMRTIWSAPERASFDGRFFSFHDVDSAPRPAQPLGPPITIGGASLAAARRAGRLGHGLIPLGVGPDRVQRLMDVVRKEAVHGGWDESLLELTVSFNPDPSAIRRLVEIGTTRFILHSPESGDLGEVGKAIRAAAKLLASVQ
jgi:probable F420-dependent oxidoreductase